MKQWPPNINANGTALAYNQKAKSRDVPMLPKSILPVFLLVVFVGAMVLGPLLYYAMQVIWPIPFHRAMDRALLICALAAMCLAWPRISWKTLWPLDSSAWKDLLLGLLIAAVTIQTIVAAQYVFVGFYSATLSASEVGARILLAFVAALLAPPLEETIFRGFLQGELTRGLGWRAGWLLTAALFMLVHFLKIPVELDKEPVHLWSGVTAIGAAFSKFGHDLLLPSNIGKAANLLLIGLILGGIVLRNRALWLNAGLHAGLVFGLLIFTGLTRPHAMFFQVYAGPEGSPPVTYDSLFGNDILSSPATSVVLMLLGIWIWRFYRHPSILPETGPTAP